MSIVGLNQTSFKFKVQCSSATNSDGHGVSASYTRAVTIKLLL